MSKTEENLKAAFAGESQARNKYTYFAEVARQEGYHYIAKFFEETAENEKQHAKDHLRMLKGIEDTIANLKEAIGGEHYETMEMYPTFAKNADGKYTHMDLRGGIRCPKNLFPGRYKNIWDP